MHAHNLAVHRTILCVDIAGFGARHRTDLDRIVMRDGLYQSLDRAFSRAGVSWQCCYNEDRGDGALVLIPPEVPKGLLVASLPYELAAAIGDHNGRSGPAARMRLRMAIDAGEVHHDDHGVTADAINHTFRLLDAGALRSALRGSPGVLALIASDWIYDRVIRHDATGRAATYRPVWVSVKETHVPAWVCLPDHPYPAAIQPAGHPGNPDRPVRADRPDGGDLFPVAARPRGPKACSSRRPNPPARPTHR